MKIVIATPLYPPDIAEPAPYTKELAKRLSKKYEVSIVAYARFPEKISGVRIWTVSKRSPLPVRLFLYVITLARATYKADIVYAENGASVEFPAGLVTLILRKPLIIHRGDLVAHQRATQNALLSHIEGFAEKRTQKVVTETPLPKPEILPFTPTSTNEQTAYEKSWTIHMDTLEKLFDHA